MDSIDRLIDYTQSIKPYHTKIYEVLTNYTYAEEIITSMTDSLTSASVPCECPPNYIQPGYGWDTQPWAEYESVLSGLVDDRGNYLYTVVENIENILWGFPNEAPDPTDDECCVDCEVWLCENVGWDTQPYGLYEAMLMGAPDELGNPQYIVAMNEDNVEWDSPQECPDAGT